MTLFTYDLSGNLLTISDADNEARKGTVLPEVYAQGMTRYTYTARNQLETETFPGETVARRYTYSPTGKPATRTDQRGIVTTYVHDPADRLERRRYSDAADDVFELDDAGRIRVATSGRYGTVVRRTWRPTGRIDTETTEWPEAVGGVASSTTVQYGYYDAARATTVTLPGGKEIVKVFTARGEMNMLQFAGTMVAYGINDDAGRRTSLIYGNGLVDTRTWTDDGRLDSTRVAGSAVVLDLHYAYDANRRKTDEFDELNPARSQHFGFDDADRLIDWSSGTRSQSWALTAVGDWEETVRDGVTEQRTHTPVHAIASVDGAEVRHDAAGNLTRMASGQGFSWDAENRLYAADTIPDGDRATGTARYWHDALGRRVAKQVHGTVTRFVHDGWQVVQEIDAPVVATTAEQADDGDLAWLATVPDGALLYPTWDAEGNRHDPTRVNFQPAMTVIPEGFIADKSRAFAARTNGLSYGWLGAAERPSGMARRFHPLPQYDTFGAVANGTDTWTWQIALPNGTYPVAIVAGDATSLAHTNNLVVNGQPLSADPDPGDDTTIPTYEQGDFDGWLVAVEVTDGFLTITAGDGAFDPTLCFIEIGQQDQSITPETWAAMQQRLADQVLAATQRTGGTAYGWAGADEVRNYVWDPAYIDHLVAYERATQAGTRMYYMHSGAQYSVQVVTDESGAVVEKYSYSAYGERAIEGVSNGGRSSIGLTASFTGRALDEETGLYYFRNRMYSGKDGRFVSRDPIGYVDGYSLYSGYYVPVATDPEGTSTYLFLYDSFDVMFWQWADSVVARIKRKSRTYFQFDPCVCHEYKEGEDKIEMIPMKGMETINSLSNYQDVVYLGSFGHGNYGRMWWRYEATKSVMTGLPGFRTSGTETVATFDLTRLTNLNWGKCALIELYHCHTAELFDLSGGKLHFNDAGIQANKANAGDAGASSIAHSLQGMLKRKEGNPEVSYVNGSVAGIDNGWTYIWGGWPGLSNMDKVNSITTP